MSHELKCYTRNRQKIALKSRGESRGKLAAQAAPISINNRSLNQFKCDPTKVIVLLSVLSVSFA
jgi:hypothetical protein